LLEINDSIFIKDNILLEINDNIFIKDNILLEINDSIFGSRLSLNNRYYYMTINISFIWLAKSMRFFLDMNTVLLMVTRFRPKIGKPLLLILASHEVNIKFKRLLWNDLNQSQIENRKTPTFNFIVTWG
jgi:hypothetical protein